MTKNALKNLDKITFIKKEPTKSMIITDIDGTISEIAPTSGEAIVEGRMKKAVALLASIYQVAVITGRTIEEAKKMIDLDNVIYLGNHGLEKIIHGLITKPDSVADRKAIKEAQALIDKVRKNHKVLIEDKGLSLAVHYRQTLNPAAAETEILKLLEPLSLKYGLRIIRGKMVVEIKSSLSDKGKAVESLVLKSDIDNVIYIGDDRTDLDAFNAVKALTKRGEVRGLSLAVNSTEIPRQLKDQADYLLASVNEARLFFLWMADSR